MPLCSGAVELAPGEYLPDSAAPRHADLLGPGGVARVFLRWSLSLAVSCKLCLSTTLNGLISGLPRRKCCPDGVLFSRPLIILKMGVGHLETIRVLGRSHWGRGEVLLPTGGGSLPPLALRLTNGGPRCCLLLYSLRMVFTFFLRWIKKIKRSRVCSTWKLYEIQISMSIKLIRTQPHSFASVLSAAAFTS